ncbi:hypothetical protein R84B8_02535 [Treponema sp. R8-4-B8]
MPDYSSIQKEETFKAAIFRDFFSSSKYAYEPNIGNIDFIVTEAKTVKNITSKNKIGGSRASPESSAKERINWKRHYLWAESKKGIADIPSMLTQLILTIKKTYEKGEHLPPPYIACFDTAKIAFVPFHDILPIFSDNDVNWNVTPSNHTTDDFIKTKSKIEKLSKKNIVVFDFNKDKNEIIDFINNNLVAGNITSKFQINKNNFVIIYTKWLDKVKKSIAIDWSMVKKTGIIDGDFFLADILSKDNYTLKDKLFVILMNNQYKFDKKFDDAGFSLYKEVGFNDAQKAHKAFWDKYERPPLEEYWDYIINRRDLLVPQDIRERKGSFFTPQQWVELSQKYIGDVLGEDWQDEYYIWDCAAGTGNLLAGLTNKYNIWASTLDKADVDVMKDRIKNGANLLEDHVFQFDFLNDEFEKLPKGLQDIIKSDKKRKKLVVYINPPYAEATSTATRVGTKENKTGVSTGNKIHAKYAMFLGSAKNELFAQFLTRIFKEIQCCKIANFATLKALCAFNFVNFRQNFTAKLESLFVVPADTFDNVKGQFPIGFHIWDTEKKEVFEKFSADVFDKVGEYTGQKTIYGCKEIPSLNDWAIKVLDEKNKIGHLSCRGSSDFQNQNLVFISSRIITASDRKDRKFRGTLNIGANNLIKACIYFAVRHCIESTWLNNRDQFLCPNDCWQTDTEFQNDCLAFTLFHSQNKISSKLATNHWIPFAEEEVNAKDNFESHFMIDFIKDKTIHDESIELFEELKEKHKALKFSVEAKAVFKIGKKLWKYYHSQPTAEVNASLYDIREFFQGRGDNDKMNSKSGDDTYNALIADLRSALKILAEKIQPKVYEYGFLLE